MSFGVLEPCSYEGCYGYRHSHLAEGLKGHVLQSSAEAICDSVSAVIGLLSLSYEF